MSGYDIDAMKNAVKDCDKNIAIFEAAIQKEQATKLEYQHIVRTLEERAAMPAPKVHLEIVRADAGDDDDPI